MTACAPALKPLFTPRLLRAARGGSITRIPDSESSGNGSWLGGYIRSKRSVEQSWSRGTVSLDALYPGNTRTEVRVGSGSDGNEEGGGFYR